MGLRSPRWSPMLRHKPTENNRYRFTSREPLQRISITVADPQLTERPLGMEVEQVSKAVEESLVQIKWRLKYRSKCRLLTDVLGLCTRMRPVVMVDYGGMMPQLQHHLCSMLHLCQKESRLFECLRVMVIEDMIYLVHAVELAKYVRSSFNSETEFYFVNLEQDPPQMVAHSEEFSLKSELVKVQKLFSLAFPLEGTDCEMAIGAAYGESSAGLSEFVDLSSCVQETEVTIPTLNGWLLGYPVVYLFSKNQIEYAIYNLSAKSLSIFRILVCRTANTDRGSEPEELMSFSVPCELSMRGSNEPWAEAFLAQMQSKWDKSKQVWSSLKMEVCECYPQAIAL